MSSEFYVNRVVEAMVVKTGSRSSPIRRWAFAVEWTDSPTLTWEPEENFMGRRWALKTFWCRVGSTLGGRDHKDLRKFKVGEKFELPTEYVRKKRTRSERSSLGLIKPEGTRVFALWTETQHYYSAVVQRRIGNRYTVRFDEDDSESVVELKHMRPCAKLRKDDLVILKSETVKISGIKADGSFVVKKRLHIGDFLISAWNIEAEWKGRTLTHKDIVCACAV